MVESIATSERGLRVRAALVRPLDRSFGRPIDRLAVRAAIDGEKAKRQHEGYVRVLAEMRLEVIALPSQDERPEGPFLEDLAVVIGARFAILSRPVSPVRRGEEEALRPYLMRAHQLHELPPNARLDGCDVVRCGSVVYVGLSEHTDEEGALFLERIAAMERLSVRRVHLRARQRDGASLFALRPARSRHRRPH